MRKPWFLLLLLLLLALVGVACGGDDGGRATGTTVDPDDKAALAGDGAEQAVEDDGEHGHGAERRSGAIVSASFVRAAAEKTTAAGTGRLELVFEMGGIPGMGETLTMAGTGSYDTEAQLAEITLDMSKLLESVGSDSPEERAQFEQVFGDGAFTVITQGTTVYMDMPFLAAMFGGEAQWISFEATAAGGGAGAVPGMGTIGTGSPAAMLDSLRGVSDDIEEVGTADVRGTSTTHLRGTIDMNDAIDQVPQHQRAQVEAALSQFGPGAEEVPFDVFVDGDGLVRRFVLDFSNLTGAQAQGATGKVSIDFFDFGAPVEIAIPPAEDVFDATEQMAGLAGAGAPGA